MGRKFQVVARAMRANRATGPVRQLLPLAIGGIFLWALIAKVASVPTERLVAALVAVPAQNWALAVLATFLSFGAVARYDLLTMRQTGLNPARGPALRCGFAAMAIAQVLGLGVVTGALVRWRMIGPEQISLWRATLLTLQVSGGFLAAGMVVLLASVALAPGHLPGWAGPAAMIGLAVLAMAGLAAILWPSRLDVPSLRTATGFLVTATADLGLAALALWLLLPSLADFWAFLPVFLLATGAGILAGTPGGVGPFEMVLIALLPGQGDAGLLAAAMGFRLVYYIVPAVLALALLLWVEFAGQPATAVRDPLHRVGHGGKVPGWLDPKIAAARRGEARLAQTGAVDLLSLQGAVFMARAGHQTLVALSDPIDHCPAPVALEGLRRAATQKGLYAVVYKAGAGLADAARQVGWSVSRIGREAIVAPLDFSPSAPGFGSLRRKLRAAQKAGVRVERATPAALPVADMARIDAEWSVGRGGARGFSMGRFDTARLNDHRYVLAWQGDRLVGYVGLWQVAGETALDLMRHTASAPQGTMHLLVADAIAAEAARGVTRFSLASVPLWIVGRRQGLVEHACHWLFCHRPALHCAPGLLQFKSSFRPHWEDRFLIAPHLAAAALAGLDIARLLGDRSR